MTSTIKRFLSLFVILSTLITCAGCQSEDIMESKADTDILDDDSIGDDFVQEDTTHITFQTSATSQGEITYDFTYKELAIDGWFVDSITSYQEGVVYFAGFECDDSGIIYDDANMCVMKYNSDVQEVASCMYVSSESEFYSHMIAADNGLWCVIGKNVDYQAVTYDLYLIHFSENGDILCEIRLPDDSQNLGACDLALDGKGNIYYKDYAGNLIVYSENGDILTSYEATDYIHSSMAADGSGDVFLECTSETGVSLLYISPDSGELNTAVDIEGDFSGDIRLSTGNLPAELMLVDAIRPWLYNTETGELIPLESFEKYGLSDVEDINYLDSNSIICLPGDTSVGIICQLIMDTTGGSSKQVITLASAAQNDEVARAIDEFNRSNPDYYVQVLDFSDYLVDGDYSTLFNAWNLAFSNQDFPDMIDFSNLPYTSYAERGYLLDLNQFIDAELILPWVWDSMKYDSKNYTFPCAVQVHCVYAKEENVGTEQWNMATFMQYANKTSSECELFYGCTDSLFLSYIENYMLSTFVDYENAEAKFNSDEFINLLKLVDAMPQQEDDIFIEAETTSYVRRNQSALGYIQVSGIKQMQQLENMYIGESVTFVGWPGVGNLVSPLSDIAIMSASDKVDGALAFLEFLMSNQMQASFSNSYIPITVSSFNTYCESLQEVKSTSSEIATEIEIDGTVYSIVPLTEDEIETYCSVLNRCKERVFFDWEISGIIEEECEAFLCGQRSAEEVANLIQNRVQIYLSEQY